MVHLINPSRVEPRFWICAQVFTWLLCLALFGFAIVNGVCIATRSTLPITDEVTADWGRLPDITMCPQTYPVEFAFADVWLEAESREATVEGLALAGDGRQANATDVSITVDENGCLKWVTSVLAPTFKRKSTNFMLLKASFNQSVWPGPDARNVVPNIELAFKTDDYFSPLGTKFAFANVNQYPVAARSGQSYGFHVRKTLHAKRFLFGSDLVHAQFDAAPRDIISVQWPRCPGRPVAPWAASLDPCTTALNSVSTFFDVLQTEVPVIVRLSRPWLFGQALCRLGNLVSVVAVLSLVVFSRKNKTSREVRIIDAMTFRGYAICDLICGGGIEDDESSLMESECEELPWQNLPEVDKTP
mmetsp:Transcript_70815/g.207509  ORF Transcript_70815/g.207509 Transcript_70815/m.207509 type:complete len:359 (-) Transcript_70815:34-1110(-)